MLNPARSQLFTVFLGQTVREQLHYLCDSEDSNQSAIIRRCITETYDRVTGYLPMDATRFKRRPKKHTAAP